MGRGPGSRIAVSAALALAALVAPIAAPASGAELLSETVPLADSVKRSCIEAPLRGGRGYAKRSLTAPAAGGVSARLDAPSGDWDVAIFDAATGDRVAGSAFRGSSEVAQGFVAGGERLTVQVCRHDGGADAAKLVVESQAVEARSRETLSLVRVSVPNRERKSELTELGLDLTEHGGKGFVDVVLHGADDAERLRDAKFIYTEEIPDLARQDARDRGADARFSRAARASALPSERTSYRHLADYSQEMKQLAAANPAIVKPVVLPHRTLTGMSVEGIEITTDVGARDGKPVFLQLGAHHAREWPSSEHAMEWAHELIDGYRAGDGRVRRLLATTRTIVVPVVNPEGFNTSREAASALADGRGGDEMVNLLLPYEYQRKNCRVNNPAGRDPDQGSCTQMPATGLSQFGVDPNRNYGGFWGGLGASPDGPPPDGDFAQDYRGNAPFSEPETQNIRDLVSHRQVTTLITNHTYANLVLRPPGVQAQGPPPDEPLYKALGDSMATENGYASQPGFQLYDTSGTTEDWSYYATGGLGFTFEIGGSNFHPPYGQVVAEYEGTTAVADAGGRDGGGNREAYFKALESTADASKHSVIAGKAPAGALLRLRKSFKTSTSPVIDANGNAGAPILFDDTLETTMEVPSAGQYAWHVNPSSRPAVRPAGSEDWTLTCESARTGRVGSRQLVRVERGERRSVDFGSPCAKVVAAARCVATRGGVGRSSVARARLARRRARQRRILGVRRLRDRRGIDRYCLQGGGTLRVGYPTRRLGSRLSRRARRRVAGRATLLLATSRRLRVRRVRVGTRVRILRRRLRGERRLRVGGSVWYVVRARGSSLLFRVRGGRVRALGLGDKRLTATRGGTQRFLRAWGRRGP